MTRGVSPVRDQADLMARQTARLRKLEQVAHRHDGSSGGGGTGTDEVSIGPSDPGVTSTIELWYDTDAVAVDPTLAFIFTQATAASVWTIDHTLSFRPGITVVDSAGDQVEGTVNYTSASRITVTFSAPFAGTAYLS